jgi:hypothetical protein
MLEKIPSDHRGKSAAKIANCPNRKPSSFLPENPTLAIRG